MEQSTVADLQQLPAWSESSPRWNAHQQGPRGLCWTVSTARIKLRFSKGRDFLQGEPWAGTCPWPSAIFAFSDEWLWNAFTRICEDIFLCDFFFFSPPSYFTCAEKKICSSSLEKTKGPVFWPVNTQQCSILKKIYTFSWASWYSLEYKQHSEPSVCWIQLSFLTATSQNLLQHTGVPRCDAGMISCSFAALSSCSAGPLPKWHCAGSCQHAWSGPQSAAPRFSLFAGLIFALIFL